MGESQGQQSNKPDDRESRLEKPAAQNPDYSEYSPDFKEFEAPDVTAWKLARTIIEHENILVNQRMTWLITSQAYLFAAFSLSFGAWLSNKEHQSLILCFMLSLGFLGAYICLVIQNSFYRAFESLDNVTKHYDLVVKKNFDISPAENGELPSRRTPPLHYWKFSYKLIDQFNLPAAIAIIWLLLLLSLGAYTNPTTKGYIDKFITIDMALVVLLIFSVIVIISIKMIRPKGRG